MVHTTDTISDEDLNSNTKLLEWSTIKFHTKVLEKISSALALRQVELATKMESVKNILENIFSLYTKLCDVNIFIHDIQRHVEQLEGDLKTTINTIKLSPGKSQPHFQRLLSTQGRLAKLKEQNANIQATLISI